MTTHKYAISLRPHKERGNSPLGFSSGRHGYQIEASSMADAIAQVIARARLDGIMGAAWYAMIVPRGRYNQIVPDPIVSCPIVNLADGSLHQRACSFFAPSWAQAALA